MYYSKITKFDTANGDGIRTVLWTSGCLHHCINCHNPETWNPNHGNLFSVDTLQEILDSIAPDYVDGLTLSGGDPLYFANLPTVKWIISKVREEYPSKNIWLYTGYRYEELIEESRKDRVLKYIIRNIDVLVDGKYIDNLKDVSLPYCGSSNQRVIDIKRSRPHHIKLYESSYR